MEWVEMVAAIVPSLAVIVGFVLSIWFARKKANQVAQSGAILLAEGLELIRLWHKANLDGVVTPDEWQEINALIQDLGPAGAMFYEDLLALRRRDDSS